MAGQAQHRKTHLSVIWHKILAYLLAFMKVSILYDKTYENFMKQVDMVDNGLSQWSKEMLGIHFLLH